MSESGRNGEPISAQQYEVLMRISETIMFTGLAQKYDKALSVLRERDGLLPKVANDDTPEGRLMRAIFGPARQPAAAETLFGVYACEATDDEEEHRGTMYSIIQVGLSGDVLRGSDVTIGFGGSDESPAEISEDLTDIFTDTDLVLVSELAKSQDEVGLNLVPPLV